MYGPEYERQVAEVRKAGWKRAAIVTPFAVAAFFLALYVNRTIGTHLDASLYGPACRSACEAEGSRCIGHRPGGRGKTGRVLCECPKAQKLWHEADLSEGRALDKVLHYGGQEALMIGAFAVLALTGMAISWRSAKA